MDKISFRPIRSVVYFSTNGGHVFHSHGFRFHSCLACFRMLYTTAVFLCALLRFLAHPKEVFAHKPNSRRGCKDNREEFGFALVGHDFKSVHAENFARCFFECSLEERCQSVTFLWKEKECQMKNETKKSRPGDFVEHPAATYMENNFRGLSIQPLFLDKGPGWMEDQLPIR